MLAATSLWLVSGGAATARRATVDSIRESFAPEHLFESAAAPDPTPVEVASLPAAAAKTEPLEALEEGSNDVVEERPPDLPTPRKPRGLRGSSFVLLLGLDNRDDRRTGRADTMILVAFRHRDGKVAAFSIPRDLWIELPELGPARINSTIRIGEHKLGPGEGIPLLRRVIRDNFGIRVDHYARVDHAGFEAAVDALGGVELDLQCPIQDCFWGEDRSAGCEMLDLPAGPQLLDGHTALLYSRSRHGRGERDRRRRQQRVLMAIAHKVSERGLRAVPELWSRVHEHVQTDLDPEAALYYASFALDEGLEQIGGFSITRELVERHVTEDGKHVLLLQRDAFDEALEQLFSTRSPALRPKRSCPAADVALTGRPRPN